MTGHGESQCQRDDVVAQVEVRTVNNRFLKVSTRSPEGYNAIETQVESVVRRYVRRGTVQVNVRIDRRVTADDYRLNESVLRGYWHQLQLLMTEIGTAESMRMDALLLLPGVVDETSHDTAKAEHDWPLIEEALENALRNLDQMRREEGAAMASDLHANCQTVSTELVAIEQRAPEVVSAYRKRLTDRVNRLLEEFNVTIEPSDVVREIGVFSDRSDISEEIVRLRSHLEQFDAIAAAEESNGRKLDFLIQEMLRETNTIGSKANDAQIARHVVEIKTAIERMREMIQNVE